MWEIDDERTEKWFVENPQEMTGEGSLHATAAYTKKQGACRG
jgi:hypothetical protein